VVTRCTVGGEIGNGGVESMLRCNLLAHTSVFFEKDSRFLLEVSADYSLFENAT